jgi:hypothetical protein
MAVNDSSAHLVMPGSRCLVHGPSFSPSWYWSNKKSTACPKGFDTEDSIKAIWGPLTTPVNHPSTHAVVLDFSSNRKASLMTISGRLVGTFDGNVSRPAGGIVKQNSLGLPNGVYFYSMPASFGKVTTGRLVVNK